MKHALLGCIAVICCASHSPLSAQLSWSDPFSETPGYNVVNTNTPPAYNVDEDFTAGTARVSRSYRSGIPDGEWRGYYPNGQTKFIRYYSADKYRRIKQEMHKHQRQIFTPLALAAKNDPRIFSRATAGDFRLLAHGLFMNFYPDGSVKDSGYYRNGLREDHWVEKTANGATEMAGTYVHGVKTGVWTVRDNQGKIRCLQHYSKKGELLSQKQY